MGGIHIQDILDRVHSAVKKLKRNAYNVLDSVEIKLPTPNLDKYSEFVFVLRSIRESYQVTQEEMAALMGVTQDTISKFESAKLNVKLDFLIFYASLLGYNIRVGSTFRSRGELSRFRRRQSRIIQTLRYVKPLQIEDFFYS